MDPLQYANDCSPFWEAFQFFLCDAMQQQNEKRINDYSQDQAQQRRNPYPDYFMKGLVQKPYRQRHNQG